MAAAIFWPTQQTNQSRLIAIFLTHFNVFRFWLNLVSCFESFWWFLNVILDCSGFCPHQTGSDHHHHPNFMTCFQLARAAFCGTFRTCYEIGHHGCVHLIHNGDDGDRTFKQEFFLCATIVDNSQYLYSDAILQSWHSSVNLLCD